MGLWDECVCRMLKFGIANYWNTVGLIFLISGILTILLVLGFYPEIFSKTSPEKEPHPIFIPFNKNCTGHKEKKLSKEEILQIIEDHSTWIQRPEAPDVSRANFCGANVSEADFSMVMLAGANFIDAQLQGANLENANLTRANFSHARFDGANLEKAMLHSAIFQEAKFSTAFLQDAMLYQSNLQGADLSNVKGLTQFQINMACLDAHTKLPRGLSRPKPCE